MYTPQGPLGAPRGPMASSFSLVEKEAKHVSALKKNMDAQVQLKNCISRVRVGRGSDAFWITFWIYFLQRDGRTDGPMDRPTDRQSDL